MAKITAIAFEVPLPDGEVESKKISLNYSHTEQKFSLKVPEHIHKFLGAETEIKRASQKEAIKALEKTLRSYETELNLPPELWIVITTGAEFAHPKGFRVDWPNRWGQSDQGQVEGSIYFDIYKRRGKTWIDSDGDKRRHFSLEETDHIAFPWTQEREDALRAIMGDLNQVMFKLFRFFLQVKRDPDHLLGRSLALTQAVRRRAHAQD